MSSIKMGRSQAMKVVCRKHSTSITCLKIMKTEVWHKLYNKLIRLKVVKLRKELMVVQGRDLS